jgi:DNA-directed RNA polymerase subunit omega
VARITVEDCLERLPNRFALVMLVAKRTKQLLKGSHPTIQAKDNKKVVVALREVAQGSVLFEGVDEQRALNEISKDLKK